MIPANPQAYLHDSDKKALTELKKVPAFDKVCSKFISVFNEPYLRVQDMSSKVHLSQQQMPRIYNMLPDICEKLGIEVPELYLELNRSPNAYTYGDKKPAITITSGLLECMEDDEIYAVLAHECGHIACHHVLYHTMGQMILNGGLAGLEMFSGNGLLSTAISMPLKLAFYYWMRCSEFSADRAAVICSGNAESVVETMMRLAGGTSHIAQEIDRNLFIGQAEEYRSLVNSSNWNKVMEFQYLCDQSHPLLSVRASEAIEWSKSQQFVNIVNGMNGVAAPAPDADTCFCSRCGASIRSTDMFCSTCGEKQNKG